MQTMKTTLWAGIFWLLTLAMASAQTNDLTALLQQGLLEEQANQNLDAAITDYQALATQFDKDRKVAATAVFRIGECYRMQGRTNEAAAQYERVLHDFSDQKILAQLSSENLKGMGVILTTGERVQNIILRASSESSPEQQAIAIENANLQAQISGIENLKSDPEEEARAVLAIFPDEVLKSMLLNLPNLQEQAAKLTANPHLSYKELGAFCIAFSGDYGTTGVDFRRGITSTNLLWDAQNELQKQMAWIEKRMDFILKNQIARLKVLQAVAESESPNQQAPSLAPNVIALEAELSMLENQKLNIERAGLEERKLVVQQIYPNPVMTTLIQHLMEVQQQVAKLEVDYSATNSQVIKDMAELNTINSQINDQIDAVVRGLENKIEADKENLANLRGHEQAMPLPTPTLVNDAEDMEIQHIKEVLQDSPDLINASSSGQTELAAAAAKGQLKVAAYLLDHGADVNNAGKGNPPLYAAAEAGNRAMVEFLLNHGADVNIRGGGMHETALHVAAENKFPAVVEVLLSHKADLNAVNNDGLTPLWAATSHKDLKMVQMLLAGGANPNAGVKDRGWNTALTEAITGDQVEIVQALLTAGADPNAESPYLQNFIGRTPLSHAAEKNDPKLVKLLLDAKADPNRGTNNAPLLLAVLKKDIPTAQLLLEHGADPNVQGQVQIQTDFETTQPLFLAVERDNLPMVQLLLKYKADAGALLNGWSPLFSTSDTNILETLLEAGAKVDPISRGDEDVTPLERTFDKDLVSAAAVLLKHGANPNWRDGQGNTVLHLAAMRLASPQMFELLLANGANPNVRNQDGMTPLDILKGKMQPMKLNFSRPRPEYVLGRRLADPKQLADLLRRHGARDKLPNWDCIAVSRPAVGFTTPMSYTSTNNWNHFTLLEAILAFYESGRQYGVPEDNNSIRISDANNALPFPDLAHIVIVRPNHTLTNDARIKVNVLNGTNGFDLAKDVPLEFGDVVEIPELDHPLGAQNTGLTTSPMGIIDRLKGTARLTAGGQTVEIKLDPIPMRSTLRAMLDSNDARGILLSSSDLSRVKVTRHDPKTGRKQEWTVDTTAPRRDLYRSAPFQYNFIPNNNIYRSPGDGSLSPNELDLWLRDGDVIEVPEKQ